MNIFVSILLILMTCDSQASQDRRELMEVQWTKSENHSLVNLSGEDNPFTKAHLFQANCNFEALPTENYYGYTFPKGKPMDQEIIQDILNQLTPHYQSYIEYLKGDSKELKWLPKVMLEVGAGHGFFAQRFRDAFKKAFPTLKSKTHEPFMLYILNDMNPESRTPFASLNQSIEEPLKFVANIKPIKDHLFSSNNPFSYDFVHMDKVSHFWDTLTFVEVLSKINQKMVLGGKLYLCQLMIDCVDQETEYMQAYIGAFNNGDICPGYRANERYKNTFILEAYHEFMRDISFDAYKTKLESIGDQIMLGDEWLQKWAVSNTESQGLSKSLNQLNFLVDPDRTYNFADKFQWSPNDMWVIAVASKEKESPDFTELLEKAKEETLRKSTPVTKESLLDAFDCYKEFKLNKDKHKRS